LVSKDGLKLLGGSPKFVACTGYTTGQFFSSAGGQPAEWAPSDGKYDLVSFTFGGNDIGFSTVIEDCLGVSKIEGALGSGIGSGAAIGGPSGAAIGGIEGVAAAATEWATVVHCPPNATLRGLIASKIGGAGGPYEHFLNKIADNVVRSGGNIVVVGYPEIVEDPKFWGAVDQAVGTCWGIKTSDAYELRGLAGDLNATIAEAVKAFDSQPAAARHNIDATYIDVNTGNPAAGIPYNDPYLFEPSAGPRHNLCGSEEWLNAIEAVQQAHSFHPNQQGNNAIAQLVAQTFPHLNWTHLTTPLSLVTSELADDTPGLSDDIVAVPDGYDALAYDQAGQYFFWAYRGYNWTKQSEWTDPRYIDGEFSASATGQVLPGMSDATFIVNGPFTGDGSGNYMALTTNGSSWGPLVSTSSRTLVVDPQVNSTSPFLHLRLAFSSSGLRSTDGNYFYSSADAGIYPIVVSWKWLNGLFIDASDNIFQAVSAQPPEQNAPLLQAQSCPLSPSSGTYTAGVSTAYAENGQVAVTLNVESSQGSLTCNLQIPATTPVVVQVNTVAGTTEWVTAPLWIFMIAQFPLSLGQKPGSATPVPIGSLTSTYGSSADGSSPYYTAPSLSVESLSAGTVNALLSQGNSEGALCDITYQNGTITAIGLLAG
jgi:hypothetical protein